MIGSNNSNLELKNTRAALEAYADDLINSYKTKLALSNASGDLINSIKSDIVIGDKKITVSLNLNSYWKYIEEGRQPGTFPNLESLVKWIEVKNILPRPMSNGKLPTTRQLAYMIGKSIKDNGIAPKPYLAESVNDINSKHLNLIREALTKDTKKQASIIVNEVFKSKITIQIKD